MSELPTSCGPVVVPANWSGVAWIGVTDADGGEGCAAMAGASRLDGDIMRARYLRLEEGAVCRHALHVLGLQEASARITTLVPSGRRRGPTWKSLRVLPFNDTYYYYPASCERGGFEVLFVAPVVSKAGFEVWDPSGKHVLFRGDCELAPDGVGHCRTLAFCPTMDVLVRVSLEGQPPATARISAGAGPEECPPTGQWAVSLQRQGPCAPGFPGDVLTIDVRLLNQPARLQAFRLELQVLDGFSLLSFETGVPAVQESSQDGRLTVSADASGSVIVGGLLGRLMVRLDVPDATGTLRVVRLLPDALRVLVGERQNIWWVVGHACPIRAGLLHVPVDHARCTAIVARARRTWIVHWQGVQAGAPPSATGIEVLGVWNTGGPLRPVAAECSSLTPGLLAVLSCDRVLSRGAGLGEVLVRFQALEERVSVRVMAPGDVQARVFLDGQRRPGRLQVVGRLFGRRLDVTPFVLPGRPEEAPVCPPGFVGNVTIGQPPLVRATCWPPVEEGELPCPAGLVLLPLSDWTPRAGYRVTIPRLELGRADAWALALSPRGLVPFRGPLVSTDPGRMIVANRTRLILSGQGLSPRCVRVTDGTCAWTVPVLPPAPVSLEVVLSATELVVQQDPWKLVPSRSEVRGAVLAFVGGGTRSVAPSDMSVTIVSGPVAFGPSWPAPGVVAVRETWLDALFEPGSANVTFGLPDIACVVARTTVRVHVGSVVSARLDCPHCPALLAAEGDPLARLWPDRFPSAVPADRFIVTRFLADGASHADVEMLQVNGRLVGPGMLVQALPGANTLSVTTAFMRSTAVVIPVVRRWAVNWSLLCNEGACDSTLRLAPPGDGAGARPFLYATGLQLAIELALSNGTRARHPWLPGASLVVNGESVKAPDILLRPGELVLRVFFDEAWDLQGAEFRLLVHALTSLRLVVQPMLKQLHCSGRWQPSTVLLLGVLSDGSEEAVAGTVAVEGGVLELVSSSSLGSTVHAVGPGVGWIMAVFANHTVAAPVLATHESMLFAGLSIDGLPEQWDAPLGGQRALHALLRPALGQTPDVVQRVVRWRTEPAGIVEVTSDGRLLLRSDHYEPVAVSGVIRSCHGSQPFVVRRLVQVNVVPDRAWQVDLGLDTGRPLAAVPVGGQLDIPVFLFCASPLLEYNATVSLAGLGEVACEPGELPFSRCTVGTDWAVRLTGNFAASQRTGRLLLGRLQGSVLLDGLARLRVSLSSPGDPATHEFTVRLGVGPVHSLLTLTNARLPGLVAPETSADWGEPARGLSVCCDGIVSRPRSPISHLVPSVFRLKNVTLQPSDQSLHLDDARLQVLYDDLILEYGATSWHVRASVSPGPDMTRIRVLYQLSGLEASVGVTLVAQERLVADPGGEVILMRLHCSSRFEGREVRVLVRLDSGQELPLGGVDLNETEAQDPLVADVETTRDGLWVQGRAVGTTRVLIGALGLRTRLTVVVLNASLALASVTMPDPYVLESEPGEARKLRVAGVLVDGQALPDASFLVSGVSMDTTAADWGRDSLVARANTHPDSVHAMVAVVAACEDAPALLVSSRLSVRLKARLSPGRPVDVLLQAGDSSSSFHVILVAERVSAFLVHLVMPDTFAPSACLPGQDLPSLADCVTGPGSLILAGAYEGTRDAPLRLAEVRGVMPSWACGHVEFFSGVSAASVPIVAGCFGNATGAVPSSLPVADPATLARQYAAALAQPWNRRAMHETRFTLQLLVGRQRLVDVRLYSNEFELSAMFGVMDRFLRPDIDGTCAVEAVFHSSLLPPHPQGVDVPGGVRVPAQFFVDGWFVVQWIEPIPSLSLRVSYRVSTPASLEPWEHVVSEALVTGRPLHECPRLAMDRASFLVVYRITSSLPADWADANFACAAQVVPRRVTVSGPDASGAVYVAVALESFARIHQAYSAIRHNVASRKSGRRLLEDPGVQLAGLGYINDTADPPVPCPPGTYFTRNGTYQPLPQHALPGLDCYGMQCVDGFFLFEGECVPATVPLNLVWVSVMAIGGFTLLVSCVLCALQMGRRVPPPPFDAELVSLPDQTLLSDDISNEKSAGSGFVDYSNNEDGLRFDRDGGFDFQNIVLGTFMDDYSRDMLMDDEPSSART